MRQSPQYKNLCVQINDIDERDNIIRAQRKEEIERAKAIFAEERRDLSIRRRTLLQKARRFELASSLLDLSEEMIQKISNHHPELRMAYLATQTITTSGPGFRMAEVQISLWSPYKDDNYLLYLRLKDPHRFNKQLQANSIEMANFANMTRSQIIEHIKSLQNNWKNLKGLPRCTKK